MELKELSAACEVVRGLTFCPGVISIHACKHASEFPQIMLTDEEFKERFGDIAPEPIDAKYGKRSVKWAGCEIISLVPIE